jgi:hypothetical protein
MTTLEKLFKSIVLACDSSGGDGDVSIFADDIVYLADLFDQWKESDEDGKKYSRHDRENQIAFYYDQASIHFWTFDYNSQERQSLQTFLWADGMIRLTNWVDLTEEELAKIEKGLHK